MRSGVARGPAMGFCRLSFFCFSAVRGRVAHNSNTHSRARLNETNRGVRTGVLINGMVEALSALRDHERMSFSEHGSPTGAVDWLRAFREIAARLMDLAARTQC